MRQSRILRATNPTPCAPMIDHISIAVGDLDRAARFYQAVLGAIGYEKLVVRPRTVGFGKTYPEFWLNLRAAMAPVDGDGGGAPAAPVRRTEGVGGFHSVALSGGAPPRGANAPWAPHPHRALYVN